MSMDGSSCYCGGSNDNCRFCFGSGVTRRPLPLPNPIARRSKVYKSRAQKPAARCPECSVPVRKLERHRRQVHGIAPASRATESPPATVGSDSRFVRAAVEPP